MSLFHYVQEACENRLKPLKKSYSIQCRERHSNNNWEDIKSHFESLSEALEMVGKGNLSHIYEYRLKP